MMGFWDRFRGIDSTAPAQTVLPDPYEAFVSTGGIPVMDPGTPLELWHHGAGRTEIEVFWRTQPNVRKVVDFIARNVASVPLHTYERRSDTDRKRVHDHRIAELMQSPRPGISPYRFWHAVHSDGLLYDRWCLIDAGTELVQVPSWRLRFQMDALRRVIHIWYWAGDDNSTREDWIEIPLSEAIYDVGYAPQSAGLSPVETLRNILDESAEAVQYRREIWANGARIPAYIERPKDAGAWTETQRNRFINSMREIYGKGGKRAGGMPVLEDGMKMHEVNAFKPQDTQDLEGRRLTAIEVASAWHIAPELVGAQQGNYSNLKEYRQMLYRDSLGPYITAWEGAVNAQLVPRYRGDQKLYVEANIESKLRGSFEEQAAVTSSATGAPWMSVDEARAMRNLPPVDGEGFDVPVQPLNVLYGGQTSPRDGQTEGRGTGGGPPTEPPASDDEEPDPAKQTPPWEAWASKASPTNRAPQSYEAKHREVLRKFFARQGAAVLSRLGAKAASWWDEDRWNEELGKDLLALALTTAEATAVKSLLDNGLGEDDYDVDRTVAFLRSVTSKNAASINEATRVQLEDAIADPDKDPAHVFDVAKDSRADQIATTAVTFASAFGVREAAHQNSEGATKTWVVTSGNPRASHAAMDGETVPLDEDFSNGLPWPGGIGGDVDEVAGCQCELRINYP